MNEPGTEKGLRYVRYIAQPDPGLSLARNRGLEAARYPITAFISDDIRVEPTWLRAVAGAEPVDRR